jgi:hypothetical protein
LRIKTKSGVGDIILFLLIHGPVIIFKLREAFLYFINISFKEKKNAYAQK